MLRTATFAFTLCILATACGGDNDARVVVTSPTEAPGSPATPSLTSSTPETLARTPTPEAEGSSGRGAGALSSIVGTLFSGAMEGAADAGAEPGMLADDPSIARFLPGLEDLPPGFESTGEFTFSAPDGLSQEGTVDIAALVAASGELTAADPAGVEMLMVMVLRPQDLRALGDAFDSIEALEPEELQAELEAGIGSGVEGLEVVGFEVLDADVGESAFGMQMTVDMSGLFALFAGGDPAAPKLSAITMRMYMFGRGDHIGAVMRMAFADRLESGVDELALARVIDRKLQSP